MKYIFLILVLNSIITESVPEITPTVIEDERIIEVDDEDDNDLTR